MQIVPFNSSYSMITCGKCNSGYYLYSNSYLFQVFDDDKQYIDSHSDSTTVYGYYQTYNALAESNYFMMTSMRHCKKTEVGHVPV